MNTDQHQIIDLLHSQGKHDETAKASSELPDQVDTDNDSHEVSLSTFEVDPSDITANLGGFGTIL